MPAFSKSGSIEGCDAYVPHRRGRTSVAGVTSVIVCENQATALLKTGEVVYLSHEQAKELIAHGKFLACVS